MELLGDWRRFRGNAFRDYQCRTLFMFYKRQLIRDIRQIAEKNKRQGLAFSKMLRDSAHRGPEAVGCKIWARDDLDGRTYSKICSICLPWGLSSKFGEFGRHLKGSEVMDCIFVCSASPNLVEQGTDLIDLQRPLEEGDFLVWTLLVASEDSIAFVMEELIHFWENHSIRFWEE